MRLYPRKKNLEYKDSSSSTSSKEPKSEGQQLRADNEDQPDVVVYDMEPIEMTQNITDFWLSPEFQLAL